MRKDVALPLLESLEVADQASVDDAWAAEISSSVDDVLNRKVKTVPGEQVFAESAAQRAARNV